MILITTKQEHSKKSSPTCQNSQLVPASPTLHGVPSSSPGNSTAFTRNYITPAQSACCVPRRFPRQPARFPSRISSSMKICLPRRKNGRTPLPRLLALAPIMYTCETLTYICLYIIYYRYVMAMTSGSSVLLRSTSMCPNAAFCERIQKNKTQSLAEKKALLSSPRGS